MAKYIDADCLKEWLEKQAHIEFKKTEENASSPVLCHFHNGCRMQALDTIDFIDSLQQEQLEVDLKKEIKEWVDLMVGATFPEQQDGYFISEVDYRSVIRQTAIHFLKKKKKKEE